MGGGLAGTMGGGELAGPMGGGELAGPMGGGELAGPMGGGELVRPVPRQDVLGLGSMALGGGAGLGSPTLAQKLEEAAAARSPVRPSAPLSMTLTAASFRKRGRPPGAPASALVNRLAQRIVEAERRMGGAAGTAASERAPLSLVAPAAPLPLATAHVLPSMDRYREPAPLYASDDSDDSEDEGQAPAKRRR
jgi:hypothetical protein